MCKDLNPRIDKDEGGILITANKVYTTLNPPLLSHCLHISFLSCLRMSCLDVLLKSITWSDQERLSNTEGLRRLLPLSPRCALCLCTCKCVNM